MASETEMAADVARFTDLLAGQEYEDYEIAAILISIGALFSVRLVEV
jgi:hypothetical protein